MTDPTKPSEWPIRLDPTMPLDEVRLVNERTGESHSVKLTPDPTEAQRERLTRLLTDELFDELRNMEGMDSQYHRMRNRLIEELLLADAEALASARHSRRLGASDRDHD